MPNRGVTVFFNQVLSVFKKSMQPMTFFFAGNTLLVDISTNFGMYAFWAFLPDFLKTDA